MEKQTAEKIVEALSGVYPDKPALRYETEFQLLIAVILSAQCTDERVNRVTAELFPEYGTPEKMLTLTKEELGKKIFSCGLYNSKAEHILSACSDIVTRFHGEVPRTDILERFEGNVPDNIKDLMSLAGVGRKTANVVYSVAMGGDAIAVDTHVFRVSNRIGLAHAKDVLNTEKQLMAILPQKDWSRTHHYLIYLGRNVCKAGKGANCGACPVYEYCERNL